MNYKAEGRKLRALATFKGVTLRKIAKDLGYHPAYVSNVLRGQDKSDTALHRIREYLEDQPDEFATVAA